MIAWVFDCELITICIMIYELCVTWYHINYFISSVKMCSINSNNGLPLTSAESLNSAVIDQLLTVHFEILVSLDIKI